MEDVFILLPKQASNESICEILQNSSLSNLFDSVKSYPDSDLCVQIKQGDHFWDIARLGKTEGKWHVNSEEENIFLKSKGIEDIVCLTYPYREKEMTVEIMRVIATAYQGYVANDEDFDENNLYYIWDFEFTI